MTSASNHPAAVLDANLIDAVADRIATEWGHHGHTALAAMIARRSRIVRCPAATSHSTRT